MNLFHKIEAAVAILRLPKGIYKQTDVYFRDKDLYVKHGGGFIRIQGKFDSVWLTSHPDVKVIDFDGVSCKYDDGKMPQMVGAWNNG